MRPLLILLAFFAFAPPAEAASKQDVAAFADQLAQSWSAQIDDQGRVADALEPNYGSFNYGTLMMASAMLRGSSRTGNETVRLAANRQISGLAGRVYQNNLFWALGAQEILLDAQNNRLGTGSEDSIAALRVWAQTLPAETHNCMAQPDCYSNQRLVQSLGLLNLVRAGIGGVPGSSTENTPAALELAKRNVNVLMVKNAGKVIHTPLGTAQALSDPGGQPNAYHFLSLYLLERINDENPGLLSAEAQVVRIRAERYALSLMAPDGQITFSGRSMDQSWALAAAAAIGARKSFKDINGGAWAAFAQKSFARLAAYKRFSDGTLAIVPGLGVAFNPFIMDDYAAQTQYNGLTMWLLEDAVDNWNDVAPTRIPSESKMLVNDLDSTGLVWARSGKVWWSISGRNMGKDRRLDQGIVGLKVQRSDGTWKNILASRPKEPLLPSVNWTTKIKGKKAHLYVVSVSGNGAKAILTGWWMSSKENLLAPAEIKIEVKGKSLAFSSDTKVSMAFWLDSPTQTEACRASSSGWACLHRASFGKQSYLLRASI